MAPEVRVFLVDDSTTARNTVRLLLRAVNGVSIVGEASTAEEALARIDAAQPDLVVMDWKMPGINGAEATKRLLAADPQVRVVGYTSSGDEQTERAFRDAGVSALFGKADARRLCVYIEALARETEAVLGRGGGRGHRT